MRQQIKEGDVVVRILGSGGSMLLHFKTGDMAKATKVIGDSIDLKRGGKECNSCSTNKYRKATEQEYSYYLQGVINIADIAEQSSFTHEIY